MKKKIFLLIIAVIICYSQIVNSPFLWDDEEMVVANPIIKNSKYLPYIFTTSAFGNKLNEGKFFRPIQIFTYFIDYQIWGLNPTGFHITNIVIHILNALLVFWLLYILGFTQILAYLGAFIFAIHPSAIEAATYISGRGDALCVFFALLSIIFFKLSKNKKLFYPFLSVLFYLLSIFTKENIVALPLIILSYLLIENFFPYKKENIKAKKTKLILSITLLCIMLGYIAFRLLGNTELGAGTLSCIAQASSWQQIITIPQILLTYLRIFIFPINLHMEYHFVTKSITSPYVWLGIPFLVASFFMIIKSLKYSKKAIFFSLWFLISLAPVYNWPIALPSTIREHWLYFPQIGLIALLLLLFTKIEQKTTYSRFSKIILGFFILFLVTSTIIRNNDWTQAIKLYKHDVKYEPKSFLLYNNLGVEYFRKKQFKLAKQAFSKSIETSPSLGYGTAYNNLGAILEKEGNLDQAIIYFQKSISSSNYYLAYVNLSRILIQTKNSAYAIPIIQKGLTHYPLNADLQYYLTVSYYLTGQIEKAKDSFQNLDKSHPNYKKLIFINTLKF
jgi:protein O-mannosyl-transferase